MILSSQIQQQQPYFFYLLHANLHLSLTYQSDDSQMYHLHFDAVDQRCGMVSDYLSRVSLMLKAIPAKIQVLLKFKSQDSSDDFLDTEKGGPLAILSKQQQ